MGRVKEVLRERRYKSGYVVRTELRDGSDYDMDDFEIRSAYTHEGSYIGDPKTAYRLCNKYGIGPELSQPKDNVCSIGFSKKDQKWYGWSHRALFGFGIGDEVKEGDCCASSGWTDEWLAQHPEDDQRLPIGFKAKNLDGAKQMAIAFAESVG